MSTVPSRLAVRQAEEINRANGHENLGFLSEVAGFLPVEQPVQQMPESHRVWDEMIDMLPELHKTLALRHTLDAMPTLSGSVDAFSDYYLLRAASLLGVMAHSYYHVEVDHAPPPPCIYEPWAEVNRRLNRARPYVSYIDLILNNWKLRDPNGGRTVDNMDLLFPSVGNEVERAFYMAQVQVGASFTPIMNAVIRAQEAVVNHDNAALEAELVGIMEELRYVSHTVYQQIDPNPYSKTHIDQVIWAKTVAPFAVPISADVPSPSGTAMAHFHMMDAFLPRTRYESLLGKQAVALSETSPPHWKTFVEAVRQVSIRNYIEESNNEELRGLYNAVVDTYAGDKGFLGVHRLKAYGFLEVAFKVGRSVTTGAKFTGLFKDRTWDKIDLELMYTRDERYIHGNEYVYFAKPKFGNVSTDPKTGQWVNFIGLDATGKGIHYHPGDRVGILAENDDAIVQETLDALQATGNEEVTLTRQWQEALRLRPGFTGEEKTLPLGLVLKFGKIRPVTRDVGKRLLKITASWTLKRVLNARMEDQWELWDLLNVLYASGFDTRRLWKADPWEAESICRIVPPEVFRLYSIASAMKPDSHDQTIELTVGGLEYETPQTPYSFNERRRGTASNFLRRMTTTEEGKARELGLSIVPTSRFHLPFDKARPVVMFAAGSGIAPFWGFLQERLRDEERGENWLFFGTRTSDQIFYRDAFEQMEANGRLNLRVAISGENVRLRFDGQKYVFDQGERQRIGQAIESEENARALWDFIRSTDEGGKGGYFYVCGRTGFAVTVMEALKNVIQQFNGGDAQAATETVRVMVAEGRYMQDIFSTYSGNSQEGKQYDISELVLHNNPDMGHWMVISGRLYDMGEFMFLHAGGERIIINNCGIDATQPYQVVLHHVNSEVDALLGMYELGVMRRLSFGEVWGVSLSPDGLHFVTLEDVFRYWVRYLYLVVGMENALQNDFDFARVESTYNEDPNEVTPFKVQFLIEAHRRFLVSYLDGLVDEDLAQIWWSSVGLCDKHQDVRWLKQQMGVVLESDSYRLVRAANRIMKDRLYSLNIAAGEDYNQNKTFTHLRDLIQTCVSADMRVMHDLKMTIREGIIAFEQYESEVLNKAGNHLMDVIKSVPMLVQSYYDQLARDIALAGITLADIPAETLDEPIPEGEAFPGHGGTQQ